MKTFEFRPHVHGRPKSKIILIMKICTFILLVFNLGLSASGYSQQKKSHAGLQERYKQGIFRRDSKTNRLLFHFQHQSR